MIFDNSLPFTPYNYEKTYTVLANDGCTDTYYEKCTIHDSGSLQSDKSAYITSSNDIENQYTISFNDILDPLSSNNNVIFYMYDYCGVLKFQNVTTPNTIPQSIIDKMIDPRQVLYSNGNLYSTYHSQLKTGIFLPILQNSETGYSEGFLIKITQFSSEPITSLLTSVKASLQRFNYTITPLAKSLSNEYKLNTWSYNEKSQLYTLLNYTDVDYYDFNITQEFNSETGILSYENNNDTAYIQLYADFTAYSINEDISTFQPTKEIFTENPWGVTFTYYELDFIFEEINYPTHCTTTQFNLTKTYYDTEFYSIDLPEELIPKLDDLVGINNNYKTGEDINEFPNAKLYDEIERNHISIESIITVKNNDTISLTYKKYDEQPVTLTGPLFNAIYYEYYNTDPSTFTYPKIVFASYIFETEDNLEVFVMLQWLYDPSTQVIVPYAIITQL